MDKPGKSSSSIYEFLEQTKDMKPMEVGTKLFGLTEDEIKKILEQKKEEEPPEENTKKPPKGKVEKLSLTLPNTVKKQEEEAQKYFTTNNGSKYMSIITQVQEWRRQGMINYSNVQGESYEVNFKFPGSGIKRYMPPDKQLNDSSWSPTYRDGKDTTSETTTRAKLRSEEGKKYMKEKEKNEKKGLMNKESFLKLGKCLCPTGSEEEQILAIMLATGFYGWMRLSDKSADYQLAVRCCRASDLRKFNEMVNANNKCSIVHTAAL